LKGFLQKKKELVLRLFENPSLLEHQSFTELLRAVLHLKEELLHRKELTRLPAEDYKHPPAISAGYTSYWSMSGSIT
jgi:hypothetical protein